MKYFFVIIVFCFVSCQEKQKSKTQNNLKAAEDTSRKVDTKKKTILNHRF